MWNKRSGRKLRTRRLHRCGSHHSDGQAGVAAGEQLVGTAATSWEVPGLYETSLVSSGTGVLPGHLIGAVIKCLGGYELMCQKRRAMYTSIKRNFLC